MPSLGLGLSTARGTSPAPSFTPASIANLAAWFDASDPATVLDGSLVPATNGAGVRRWISKASGAFQLNQTTSGFRPTLDTTGGPNGGRCVRSNGVNQWIGEMAFLYDYPCTVFTVLYQDSFTNSEFFYSTRGAGSRPFLYQRVSAGNLRGPNDTTTVTQSMTTWNCIAQRMDATTHDMRIDGGAWQSAANSASAGATSLYLFAPFGGTPACGHGRIAAHIAYSRILTDPEIAQVQNYIAATYGTPP
jgi:hypothetical protein